MTSCENQQLNSENSCPPPSRPPSKNITYLDWENYHEVPDRGFFVTQCHAFIYFSQTKYKIITQSFAFVMRKFEDKIVIANCSSRNFTHFFFYHAMSPWNFEIVHNENSCPPRSPARKKKTYFDWTNFDRGFYVTQCQLFIY